MKLLFILDIITQYMITNVVFFNIYVIFLDIFFSTKVCHLKDSLKCNLHFLP